MKTNLDKFAIKEELEIDDEIKKEMERLKTQSKDQIS